MGSWSLAARTLWQSWNGDAVRALGTILQRPSLLKPRLCVENISHLDIDELRRCGVKAVVLDKDNTITAPYADNVHPSAALGLERLQNAFPTPRAVSILSNSAGTPDDVGYADALHIEKTLGLPVIRHLHKKPNCLDDVMDFLASGTGVEREQNAQVDGEWPSKDGAEVDDANPLDSVQLRADQVAMVGDRLFTDVAFGNLHGMYTVHCQPLSTTNDNPAARVIRTLENALILPIVRRIGDHR
eukprot:INCI15955.1.p1 GENE.INCI15955.1~~INCI15955.1.p1  ORF type:complete len:243 (-),score=39.74 INCI15955.1:314-1042(-)